MDEEVFKKELNKAERIVRFDGKTIEVSYIIINNSSLNSITQTIVFKDCVFGGIEGSEILFDGINKPGLNISFTNCSFSCNIYFRNCDLNTLEFPNLRKIGNIFRIAGNHSVAIKSFFFTDKRRSEDSLGGNITIRDYIFEREVKIEDIVHSAGSFSFENNILKTKRTDLREKNASFINSTLNNANFSGTNFGEEVSFDRITLNYDKGILNFQNTIFGKAYFNGVNFGKHALFNGSKFNGNALFIGCKNLENTIADFSGCNFKKQVFFDGTKFKCLDIKNAIFENMASFSETEFDEISLDRTIFEKAAFFDDVKINKVKSCNRKTLRQIKNELLKTENRIEANKFKAYELEVYKKEKKSWKDQFILWVNSVSSNHGLDWVQGIKFTMGFGMLFYIFYFVFENSSKEFLLDGETFNHFLLGYFNYLIPWYQSPFENGLTMWYHMIFFLLGKIVIGYGIYQTVSSFRKFRF